MFKLFFSSLFETWSVEMQYFPLICRTAGFIWLNIFVGTEPPDAGIEKAGIIALQSQEIQVDHSVSALYCLADFHFKKIKIR